MLKSLPSKLLPLLVLVIAVLIAWLLIAGRADIPRRESAAVVPTVTVQVVEPGPVSTTIQSRGTVAAKHNIELVSEVSGRVIWVAPEFVEGGRVPQGHLLLRIDPIDYEVALSEATAALASANFSLAEVQVVLKRAAIEEAQARVQAAQDRIRQAQANLKNTEIRAPFAAIVDLKRADLGQYVQAGSAVMKLLGTERAEVRLPLLASDVPFVNYGQLPGGGWHEAELSARFGSVQYSWTARLVRVEQRVDAQTRVFYLVAEVDQPYNEQLHPRQLSTGLFVEALIQGVDIPNAVRLPRTAVHSGSTVYLENEGVLARREVSVLRHQPGVVIVGQGLSSGERVVLTRMDMMLEGMSVTVEQ